MSALVPRGIAISGLEFGSPLNGVLNTDFYISSQSTFNYFATKGFNTARLPFLWERIQPKLYGALDATYLSYIDDQITKANAAGLKVIFDMHNYARRVIYTDGGITEAFTAGTEVNLQYPYADYSSGGSITLRDYGRAFLGTFTNPLAGNGYTVTTKFTFSSRDHSYGGEGFAIEPMYIDDNNKYEMFFDYADSTWYLNKHVGGVQTTLVSGTKTWDLTTQHTVVIDVNQGTNGKINVTLDGTALWTTNTINADSVLAHGKVGFFPAGMHIAVAGNLVLNISGDTSTGGGAIYRIGDTQLPYAAFADVWGKIASQYKNNTTVYGFDLMNEPHDMPVPTTPSNYNTTSTVTNMYQAAINAIRASDTYHFILCEFDGWAGGQSFTTQYGSNPTPFLTDTAGKLVYSFHYYFDNDHSGTYPIAFASTNNTNISSDVSPVMTWAQNHNLNLHCGEYGVPNTSDWQVCLTTFLTLCNTYSVWTNHWAAGDPYTSPTTLQPTGSNPSYVDRLQMAIVGSSTYLGTLYYVPPAPAAVSFSSTFIQVFVSDLATGNLFELPYTKIQYIEELNNGGSATFDFDYLAVKEIATKYATTPLQLFTQTFREIWLERNNVKLWQGVISEYNRTKDTSGKYTLTVAAVDYFSVFQKRRTGLARLFTGADPATIAWTLINDSQGSESPYSDFGITQGAADLTGLSQTITYQFAEIRQEIIKLSNATQYGSFDFDIDYTKKFNTYFPTKGAVRNNIYLDDNNIVASSIKIPLVLSLTNEVYVVGNGVNSDVLYANRQSSSGYKASYKKLEDVVSDSQQTDINVLNSEGDRFLSLNESPIYTITVKHMGDDPDISTYSLGDSLILNIPEESISYSQYRVKKRTIDIDDKGTFFVQVDFQSI